MTLLTNRPSNAPAVDRGVTIRFEPLWAYIDNVREFCRSFARTTFRAPEIGERVSLVIQELLENAAKYSVPGEASELQLRVKDGLSHVEVMVTSVPLKEHRDALVKELAMVNALDPETSYASAMRRAIERNDASSRLGLARIRHEGRFDLSIEDRGDQLRVIAKGDV